MKQNANLNSKNQILDRRAIDLSRQLEKAEALIKMQSELLKSDLEEKVNDQFNQMPKFRWH